MKLKNVCLKALLHNKLITDEDKSWMIEHFGDELATMIKRWWKRELMRHEILIGHMEGKLVNKRKHGTFYEERDALTMGDLRVDKCDTKETYLFGVLHGECTYRTSWCEIDIMYKFGKKHGREYDDDIEFNPVTFQDWAMGKKHGLYHYQCYHNSSKLELYLDDVKVEEKVYSFGSGFSEVIWDLAEYTEGLSYEEWFDVSLP